MNPIRQSPPPNHFLRWLILAFLVAAFGAARPAQAQVTSSAIQVCKDDVQATFTNKTCNDTLVGLAVYCIPKDDVRTSLSLADYYNFLNQQVLYCYAQGTVKAGKCLTLSVDIPWTCKCPTFQADTFTGCVVPQFHNSDYGTRYLQGLIANSYDPWACWGG